MKRSFKIASFAILGLLLTSCGGEGSTVSASSETATSETSDSASSVTTATSVYIAGSSSVRVGNAIQLEAALDNGETDTFTWSLSDSSIASVDTNGTVTGISEGTVTVYATSSSYPSLTGEKTISVIADQATSVTMSVEGYAPDSSGIYNIPIGETFRIVLTLNDANARTPDSYAFSSSTSSSSTPSYLTLTNNGDGTADAVAYSTDTGVTIKGTATYSASSTSLSDAALFNFYDDNASDYSSFQNYVSSFSSIEKSSLVSSTITRTIEEDGSTSTEKAVNTIYSDATYTEVNDDGETTNYYSGYYRLTNSTRYYSFSYNDDMSVDTLYNNEAVTDTNNAGTGVDYHSGPSYYGIADVINSYLCGSSSLSGSFLPLGNSNIYASATFGEDDDAWNVYSSYTDADTANTYNISLVVNKDATYGINGYTFTETVSSSSSTSTYTETASDFVFSSSKSNNTSSDDEYIDIASYYMTAYHLEDITGNDSYTYYQDESKYGADEVTTEEYNGETINHYTLTNNKSLAIAVVPDAPSTASTQIDSITVGTAAVEEGGTSITAPTILGNGIGLLNAPQNDSGVTQTSDTYVTYQSINGITHTIRVTFIDSVSSYLTVDHVTGNDFGSIFKGELSDYCLINTDDDSLEYTYKLVIDEGEENGISLYQWTDDNAEGMPGYSYSIQGDAVGTYKFHFATVEDESIVSEQFTITVEAPYTVEYLSENIVGKTYTMKWEGSSYSWSAYFETTTNIVFTEDVSYSSTLLTQNIAYHFEEGAIVVDSEILFEGDRSTGDESSSSNTGFYFFSLKAGNITFTRDLKTLTFYMNTSEGAIYAKYEFTLDESEEKSDFASYIDGKTFESSGNWVNYLGSCSASVSFDNGSASMSIYAPRLNETITATFNYTYDDVLTRLMISDALFSNESVAFFNSYAEYNESASTLAFKINYNNASCSQGPITFSI